MPVLIIGVFLLVILLITFGGNLTVFTPTRYGYLSSSRTISLGNNFTISYTTGEENVGSLSGEVSNGVFSKSDKTTGFQVSNLDDTSEGLIKLKIWNTNHYGNLIILVNGKEVYREYANVGERLISFDKSILKDDNVLEVKAESSGWMIWAPTVYIFDADVSIDYAGRKMQTFTFDLNNLEITNVNVGRILIFGTRTGDGNLNVRINGIQAFSGYTTVYSDFPTDILRVGNNTVELATEPNTSYEISSAQIILYFG
jgi:hypothetical protein